MIQLLSFFTYVAPASGADVLTPWMNFPADHQCAEYWVQCVSVHSGAVNLTLETSIDGIAVDGASGPTSVNTVGLTRTELTDGLGPKVRLRLAENSGGGGTVLILTVWLVPKIGG